ncbi:FAD-dependent monooxygenase [Cyanobium sp. ATX-6F1]|uniref:FAD-dependent monooxygenase n=1 Tax=Cyanobium sp. ATX-6F1 TaxID=3137388 RepID=UPI0039BE88F2
MVGAGPTGALAALVLAQAGWRVQLLDPLGTGPLKARSRAYALNHSSQDLLQQCQLWEALGPDLVPFRQLELCDLSSGQRVPFSTADLGRQRSQRPDEAVGWVLDHGPLMTLLLERLAAHPAVDLQLGSNITAISTGAPEPPTSRSWPTAAAPAPAAPWASATGASPTARAA